MKALLTLSVLCGALLVIHPLPGADDKESKTAKEALQALNDYIGTWKGNGEPAARPANKDFWSETVTWKWRFKGDDAWLVMAIQNGKHFKSAELRYLPDKQQYELKAVAKDGKKVVFLGELKDDFLVLDFQVACTKEGESLGAEERKVVCVVTGGLGKIPVTYKGQTYYVCCSGCKDAFEENPEKILREFEARKAKK